MNPKSLIILVLAGVSGLGAMMGVSQLIKNKPEKAQETTPVVTAARELRVEELLKPDALKLVNMPKTQVPEGALVRLEDCQDRWVNTKILAGEPLVEAKLAAKGTPPGLVAAIPKGMRAFAIEVNEQTGVSGFILPQHRVDVIQTKPAGPDGRVESETILQNVLVLAAGQTFTRPEDKSIIVRTVTFAVNPDQVQSLVRARARGPLSLSLRGVNDNEIVEKAPEPEKPEEKKVEPPPPPPPPVEVAKAEEPPPPPAPKFRLIHIFRGPPGGNNRETIVSGKKIRTEEEAEEDESDGLSVMPVRRKPVASSPSPRTSPAPTPPPPDEAPAKRTGDGPPE